MQNLPSIMKAVLLKGNGGIEQLDYREDVPVPVPRADEVLVRIGAAAINNTDINTRTAWYSRAVTSGTTAQGGLDGYGLAQSDSLGWMGAPPVFPRIQGADACGFIVAIGADVDAARLGERVLIEPLFRVPVPAQPGRVLYFGSECDGAFAEFACVPSRHAHKIDSALSDVELASFPCAFSAAENMLTQAALKAGERVLITGASGGVGSAAVQLARRRGAHVIAVAAESKAAGVKALGAAQVIARTDDIAAILGRESLDVVVDVVGGPQFPQLLDILRRGGRYVVAGAIGGPIVELDLRTLYLKDLRLIGCTVFDAQVFRSVITCIERGEIKPVIASVYPLREIVVAQQEFLAKRQLGKIILVP